MASCDTPFVQRYSISEVDSPDLRTRVFMGGLQTYSALGSRGIPHGKPPRWEGWKDWRCIATLAGATHPSLDHAPYYWPDVGQNELLTFPGAM